mmetsp:Transcript_13313/g.34022  ORF Transcript_13313/g.34022 Transcript_13313/m.34022 type:complete len:324 (-) Transcript_13313:2327-3298(-)
METRVTVDQWVLLASRASLASPAPMAATELTASRVTRATRGQKASKVSLEPQVIKDRPVAMRQRVRKATQDLQATPAPPAMWAPQVLQDTTERTALTAQKAPRVLRALKAPRVQRVRTELQGLTARPGIRELPAATAIQATLVLLGNAVTTLRTACRDFVASRAKSAPTAPPVHQVRQDPRVRRASRDLEERPVSLAPTATMVAMVPTATRVARGQRDLPVFQALMVRQAPAARTETRGKTVFPAPPETPVSMERPGIQGQTAYQVQRAILAPLATTAFVDRMEPMVCRVTMVMLVRQVATDQRASRDLWVLLVFVALLETRE